MSRRSGEYWAQRLSRQNQKIGDKTADELEERMRQYYRAASADITKEAEGLYNRLLAEAGDQPVRPNDLYRLDRMVHLQSKIHKRLRELGEQEIGEMDDRLVELAELVDKSTVSGLPDAAKNSPWTVLPREQAEAIANRIWCADGKNWSDRIWKNKAALQQRIEKGMVDIIVRGEKPGVLTQTLMADFGVGYREASRIVRTETAHVRAEAEAAALEREGYEKYKFVNASDGRTCGECGELNGRVFRLADRKPGVNFPPVHPNCRGRIVAVDKAESSRSRVEAQARAGLNEPGGVANPLESGILGEEEQAAVRSYISGGSYALNAKLRGGLELSPYEQELVDALDAALEKLPVFEGEVIRSLVFYDRQQAAGFLDGHTVGRIVEYSAYTSASTNNGYHEQPHVLLHIQSKTGRDIRVWNPGESEILFLRHARFRVLDVYMENGVVHIRMEEI